MIAAVSGYVRRSLTIFEFMPSDPVRGTAVTARQVSGSGAESLTTTPRMARLAGNGRASQAPSLESPAHAASRARDRHCRTLPQAPRVLRPRRQAPGSLRAHALHRPGRDDCDRGLPGIRRQPPDLLRPAAGLPRSRCGRSDGCQARPERSYQGHRGAGQVRAESKAGLASALRRRPGGAGRGPLWDQAPPANSGAAVTTKKSLRGAVERSWEQPYEELRAAALAGEAPPDAAAAARLARF